MTLQLRTELVPHVAPLVFYPEAARLAQALPHENASAYATA